MGETAHTSAHLSDALDDGYVEIIKTHGLLRMINIIKQLCKGYYKNTFIKFNTQTTFLITRFEKVYF